MKKVLVVVFLFSAGAAAQQTNVDIPTPHPPALPPAVPLEIAPRVGITSEVELTLSEVVGAVLANNRDVEVSRLSSIKAVLSLRSAKGYFYPVFGETGYVSKTVTPVASSLGGGTNGAVTEKDTYADPQISGNS